jgi:uncharacterized protein YceH (UPF0502 family)
MVNEFSPEAMAGPASEAAEGMETVTRPRRLLNEIQRRVAGVLIEKAKTTPDQYPLTLNALTTGCNQKSNRCPQLNLDPDDVQMALDDLRRLGAVVELQSGGRVAKYKHCLYEWLGVNKVELAVLAELLLRGTQTVGELRGRAARMEPIPDLASLEPVLGALRDKGLVVELTPPGRGQMVTHGLFEEAELDHLRSQFSASPGGQGTRTTASAASSAGSGAAPLLESLQRQVDELTARVERLEALVGE